MTIDSANQTGQYRWGSIAGQGRNTPTHTRKQQRREKERSQEAAEDRQRKDTNVPEGIQECLSGVPQGVLDHTQMNTSVTEHREPQQRMQRGVEG